MSIRASNWAKTVRAGSPAKKCVLMILAEHCDQWGFTWAGQQLIANEAEVNRRSVQRYVVELAEQGVLAIYQAREQDGRKRNLYRLMFQPAPKDELPDHHPMSLGKYKLLRGPDIDRVDDEPRDNLPGGHATVDAPPCDTECKTMRHLVSHEPYRTVLEPQGESPPLIPPQAGADRQLTITERRRTKRGTRLSEDWTPSEDDVEFARERGLDPTEIQNEADRFRDYWIAKAGAQATKLDWAATWRNWIRLEVKQRPPARAGPKRRRGDNDLMNAFGGLRREIEGVKR